jgi:hypothetical protein
VSDREPVLALPMLALDELLARPPAPPEWIWEGRIAAGDVALWIGDPGVGKSMVALSLSIGVATGGAHLLDERCAPGGVLYVDLENTVDQVWARLRALGLAPGASHGLGYVHRPPGFNLGAAEWRDRLHATVFARRPQLLVIDSMRRAAAGLDENDSTAVAAFMAPIRDLAAEFDCAIVLVHHPRKPLGGEKVDALHAARGSGDLVASVDALLYFRRLDGLVRIEHAKTRRGHPHEPTHYRIVEDDTGQPVLELVDVHRVERDDLDRRVLEHVSEHPGDSTKTVENAVEGSRRSIREALARGATLGLVAHLPGRHPQAKHWYPANHAALESPGDLQATLGDMSPDGSNGVRGASRPAYIEGGRHGDSLDDPRPLTGDPMYPVMLAEAERGGHITEEERAERYALHKLVERSREEPTL